MSHARRKRLLLTGLLTVALVLGVLLIWRDSTPVLTAERLLAAAQLWERSDLSSYDLTLQKEADTLGAESWRTEVRNGETTGLRMNGAEIAVKDSYTVPGLFEIMERELEMSAAAEPLPGQPRGALLKAIFHDTLGVPLTFKRIAPNRQSYVVEVKEIALPGGEILWKE